MTEEILEKLAADERKNIDPKLDKILMEWDKDNIHEVIADLGCYFFPNYDKEDIGCISYISPLEKMKCLVGASAIMASLHKRASVKEGYEDEQKLVVQIIKVLIVGVEGAIDNYRKAKTEVNK